MYKDELYHHGIQGQKWGIRRYQNEDGSLTDAGKKRYAKLESKIQKQQKNIGKYQNRIDKNSGSYSRGAVRLARAANMRSRALNGLLVPKKKREKLLAEAARLEASGSRLQSKTLRNKAKIERAQSLINKYSRQIAKFNPSSTYAGSQYINGYYQKKLSDI